MADLNVVGRFAPTPSGRMHLGNVFSALMAYLSVKNRHGELVLRMEDLDTQRTSTDFADILRLDMAWLGLTWDREQTPQSQRTDIYDRYFEILKGKNLLYPCFCTRSQLHSVNAPHLADGTYVYPGTCRFLKDYPAGRKPSWRILTENKVFTLFDKVQGHYSLNLETECGDFVVRRADGCYVYQLAVTVDDAEAGVTEVVRGMDLLSSAPRQMYLQDIFGFPHPEYAHVPMLLAPDGRRLSKRDRDLDLGELKKRVSRETIFGTLAHAAGIIDQKVPISLEELTNEFDWNKVRGESIYLDVTDLLS